MRVRPFLLFHLFLGKKEWKNVILLSYCIAFVEFYFGNSDIYSQSELQYRITWITRWKNMLTVRLREQARVRSSVCFKIFPNLNACSSICYRSSFNFVWCSFNRVPSPPIVLNKFRTHPISVEKSWFRSFLGQWRVESSRWDKQSSFYCALQYTYGFMAVFSFSSTIHIIIMSCCYCLVSWVDRIMFFYPPHSITVARGTNVRNHEGGTNKTGMIWNLGGSSSSPAVVQF